MLIFLRSISFGGEHFVAMRTLERRFAVLLFLVIFQVTQLRVALAATIHRTHKPLVFGGVGGLMSFQLQACEEFPIAFVTFVRTYVQVAARVHVQRPLVDERFATVSAQCRLRHRHFLAFFTAFHVLA